MNNIAFNEVICQTNRRSWDPELVPKEIQALDQSITMFNLVKVCAFCAQYFDPEFPGGIAAPEREPKRVSIIYTRPLCRPYSNLLTYDLLRLFPLVCSLRSSHRRENWSSISTTDISMVLVQIHPRAPCEELGLRWLFLICLPRHHHLHYHS